MSKKLILVIFLALSIVFLRTHLWANDDSIMDVDNHSATWTGSWGISATKILYYGDNYRWATGAGTNVSSPTAEATFTTAETAGVTGTYHVYVRWTTHPNREESARFRIYDGTTYRGNCDVNQTLNGGEWRFCDDVTLTIGNRGVVKLGNENCPTNKVVIADAVRFVRVSKDKDDIIDEPGSDYSYSGSKLNTSISSNCSSQTNLTYFTLNAPADGYVVVTASGIVENTTTDRWVRVCIDNTSGGGNCDSLETYLENIGDEVSAADYEDERRYVLQEVYTVSKGSNTFYLKACRQSGATGTTRWNDFVGMFFPTRY